ncbi:MAG: alkaline phosphatase D family protein [Polaribacter sp.]|nr:alkaline phosphatase D family protein [Polaribacter sp.]MDG1954265.1 alkaline phosphatase D family protein [Polaribacter sp.]MDG2074004.1 alkaline phosphatase D family protein [Polaribacter sp.]
MKKITVLFILLCCLSCKTENEEFIISFGSCNKQYVENILWNEIAKNNPKVWIWGGDNVYSDTDSMPKLKADYEMQWRQKGYKELVNSVDVLATWDDHDYGLNDGGVEFYKKKESQQEFLDFLKVPKDDIRRNQEGVYHSKTYKTNQGSIKVIVLDTRYFRTGLTVSADKNKRYQPNKYGEGTVLGPQQWKWFQNELSNSNADFNIIVSSIQLLSYKHGYESWGTFPHEVDKMKNVIKTSKAKGVLVLSGDRHISEFSGTQIEGLSFPLIDFTSSGLTHSYSSFKGEENPDRIGEVVSEISFGILKFDFKANKITMQMRGKDNVLQQEITQSYN